MAVKEQPTRKENNFKGRQNRGKQPWLSKEKATVIVPFNEMTEAQRIAEGLRPPFVVKYDFSKTPREKELLKKERRKWDKSQSNNGVWTPNTSREVEYRLTVHVKHPDTKTTHSFMLKPSEVRLFVKRNFVEKDMQVTKAYYAGRPYKVSA